MSERMWASLKRAKSVLSVLLVLVLSLAASGCGHTVTVEEYRESVAAAAEEFNTAMDEFEEVLGQVVEGNAESIDAVISKITDLEKSGEKLRDLKVHQDYTEVQEKYQQSAQKYLDAFAKYKEAFTGYVSNSITQEDFESAISDGSALLKEGAELMNEANTLMRDKNAQ